VLRIGIFLSAFNRIQIRLSIFMPILIWIRILPQILLIKLNFYFLHSKYLGSIKVLSNSSTSYVGGLAIAEGNKNRHLSKIQNRRHKHRSGQRTLAGRKKYAKNSIKFKNESHEYFKLLSLDKKVVVMVLLQDNFLRFRFRLLTSYGSGSDFNRFRFRFLFRFRLRFPLRIWTIKSTVFTNIFVKNLVFLNSKLFNKEKIDNFQRIYCKMWMQRC
jgi:hypothetical protein